MAVDQCLAAVENLMQTNTLLHPEYEKSESKMRELEEKINYFKSVHSSDQQKRYSQYVPYVQETSIAHIYAHVSC